MVNYLLLYYEFFKIGLFSIGGGMATVPFLYALADKYPWFSREMLIDMIAISESTPGPIGINMSTYAGFNAGGLLGGIAATFALIAPSIFIMAGLVRILDKFRASPLTADAFYGLRPTITALIASAGMGIAAITVVNLSAYPHYAHMVDYKQLLLLALLLALNGRFKKIQPVHLIALAAVAGVLFKF